MASSVEFLVSKSGQMSLPADVRRRWGLSDGGPIVVVDLGDVVVLTQLGADKRLLGDALSAEEHARFVDNLEDPDLAST